MLIVVRVSSKEQELEGYSLEAQERYLRDYCDRSGLIVAKVFFISESASKAIQRKTFNEAMAYLKKHHITNFVCEKVDRLLRNFRDVVMVEEWLNGDDSRRLHCPKNSLVLHKNSSSQEKFVWGMHVVVAKNYTDNLSEEVRKGQLEKLRQGWLPRTPPLGYENVSVDGKRIQRVVPEVAAQVIKLFKMAATGRYTLTTLAAATADIGLLDSAGKPLSRTMVHRMLHSQYYSGVIAWDGHVYPGSHEPIISRSLYEKVQQVVSRPLRDGPRYMTHSPLFKGLVTCASCGRLVVWETQKGNWYGKCRQSRRCPRKNFVRQEAVENMVVQRFQSMRSPNPHLVTWLREGLEGVLNEEFASVHHAQDQLERRRAELVRRREVLYDDRLEDRITPDQYDAKAAGINSELLQIKHEARKLESGDTAFLDEGLRFLELVQNVAEEYQQSKDVERKRELVSIVFDSLVFDGETLRVIRTPRASWAFDIRNASENAPFEPDDNASTKQKRAPSETPRSTWLGTLNTVRTLFQSDCQ